MFELKKYKDKTLNRMVQAYKWSKLHATDITTMKALSLPRVYGEKSKKGVTFIFYIKSFKTFDYLPALVVFLPSRSAAARLLWDFRRARRVVSGAWSSRSCFGHRYQIGSLCWLACWSGGFRHSHSKQNHLITFHTPSDMIYRY